MNKIYRLIWSRTREMWIAVSEKVAAGWFNRSLTVGSLVAAALLSTVNPASALDPNALPTGGQVVAGKAAINQSGNVLTIQQSTDKLIANWNTFNIGQNASVAFQQPVTSSVALNRILDQNPSQIFGSLTANGQVFLLNPAGVYFGPTATVDVGGLVASSLSLSNENFLSGKYLFENKGAAGSVVNQGTIRTADGGYVAFLSPVISNEGTISTPGGATALAAGDKVSLDFTGDKLVSFTVKQGAINSLIENKGLIQAEGGLVQMTARAANELIQAVVNNTGIIEAKGIAAKGGRILLDGDEVMNRGTLNTSAREPFFTNGSAKIDETLFGGAIKLLGNKVTLTGSAILDAAGDAGGGEILIGGNYQGKGPEQNARETYIGENVKITADAITAGRGGKVIVWADHQTTFNGSIEARGGAQGGDGGFVETSGHTLKIGDTALVNASASKGKAGWWLLDPKSFTVGAGGDITGTSLSNSLENGSTGTNVEILSSGGGTEGGGDINVNQDVAWSKSTFTLTAARDININAVMTASGASKLVMNTNTANGADSATGSGDVKVGTNADGTFKGRVDFGARHDPTGVEGILTINHHIYKVFNADDLGAESSGSSSYDGTLQGIRYNADSLSGYYALGANIDASGTAGWNYDASEFINKGFSPIGGTKVAGFTGAFNGLGHTITSLSIKNKDYYDEYIGLFGYLSSGATVSNVGLTGGNLIVSSDYVGALAGYNDGSIINIHAAGSVTGRSYVGALTGYNNGLMNSSHAAGTVSGNGAYAGALAGYNNGSITNAWVTDGVITSGDAVGGLVGYNNGVISNSHYNLDSVTIKGAAGVVTIGGVYNGQFSDWLTNNKTLNITNYPSLNLDGSGHYVISNTQGLKDLLGFADVPGLNFKLGGNIDISGVPGLYIPYFAGGFDGDGKSISNVTVNMPYAYFIGFFGKLASGGSVANLSLANVQVSGSSYVGGLVGWNAGSITNASATGTVKDGNYIGGLVGWNAGSITNASATGTVKDGNYIGGLVGWNAGAINNSSATGAVSGGDGGGLVSQNYGTITNSYATGTVTGGGNNNGGLAAVNIGTITDSYATGSVTGSYYRVGGLVGSNSGAIVNSYATGAVTGSQDYVGGLVGQNYSNGSITDSYATGSVTGSGGNIGGLVGYDSGNGTITNSHYNIDAVSIKGATGVVTLGGLYGGQYNDWFNDHKTLNITNYPSLSPDGSGHYVINGEQGLKDLLGFADATGLNFKLGGNIDMSGVPGLYIPYFAGAFDGADKTIANFTMNKPSTSFLGFFGKLTSSASVANVSLTNVQVTGKDYIGGLAGWNYGAISNSNVAGPVTGSFSVGGLVGQNESTGSITGSYAACAVTGSGYDVGGLVGQNFGPITDSYATGSVIGTSYRVGGLTGRNTSTITGSYATGAVTGNGYGYYIGGLAGWNDSAGVISDSYATGAVTGKLYVGGLTGQNFGAITGSHAIGNVTGVVGANNYGAENVGGLTGWNKNNGAISDSYATGSVTGKTNVGGLAGLNDGSITGSYATTGAVTGSGDQIGGLVGWNKNDGVITGSYAASAVTGKTKVGGLAGLNDGSITNSYYNIEAITINGATGVVTLGGLYSGQYNDWFNNNKNTLNISSYYSHDGDGPYVISDEKGMKDLLAFADMPGLKFKLGGSISLSGVSGFFIPYFAGELDGDSKTISNLNVTNLLASSLGFFGQLASGATVANILLTSVNVTGSSNVGGLVGVNYGSITSSYVAGTVTGNGDNVGGLAGVNNASITGSTAADTVKGKKNNVGGLTGYNNGTIVNSHANNTVEALADPDKYGYRLGGKNVGGLTGYNNGTISGSDATGTLTNSGPSNMLSGEFAGGLVGLNDSAGTIDSSYATKAVTGGSYSGGLAGKNYGAITGSHATGAVSGHGSYIGGLTGQNDSSGVIIGSYAEGAVTGSGINIGGLAGQNNSAITNSYATGAVTATGDGENIGGLVGQNNSTITGSHATGSVTGGYIDNVGGLVGWNGGSITDAYAAGAVAGNGINIGGLAGYNDFSSGIITNSHYNINAVQIKGSTGVVTLGGLYSGQYNDWFTHDKTLDIANYSSLSPDGNGHYVISDTQGLKDLLGFADVPGLNFKLGSNIDMSGVSGLFIPYFAGGFDGDGKTISNFTANVPFAYCLGFFGQLLSGASATNVSLTNVQVTSRSYVGGLAGWNSGGITGSHVTGNVAGDLDYKSEGGENVGGLAGLNSSTGTISDSSAAGAVTGKSYVGGLAGWNDGAITGSHVIENVAGYLDNNGYGGENVGGLAGLNSSTGVISDSSAAGAVTGSGCNVGGLVGRNDSNIAVTNSHATGTVTGTSNVGGLMGYNNGAVANSHATGRVTGASYIGGLVGWNDSNSAITNSHATGAVTGSGEQIGGLVGVNYGAVANSHATGRVTGANYVGGLVGINNGAVTNSHAAGGVTGTADGAYVGGLTAYNAGTITNAYAIGAVTGAGYGAYVGGLAGYNDGNGTITASYSTGRVTGINYMGGLVGFNFGSVTNSYATGSVTGTGDGAYVGGFAGYNAGTITNAYAIGTTTGTGYGACVGGFAGVNDGTGAITTSYATGLVTGTGQDAYAGGLVGVHYGTISNSYWDRVTSGMGATGVGLDSGTVNGSAGLTTSGMMQRNNFIGFDFNTVWYLSDNFQGNTRPFLSMEYATTISNAHQLQLMDKDKTAIYTLADNIDLSELKVNSGMWGGMIINQGFLPIGTSIAPFTGTFNGTGYTVNDIFINRPSTDHVGLFGYTNHATISNTGVFGGSVTGASNTGALIGTQSGGSIGASFSTATVSGASNVGGLTGYNSGSMANTYSTGSVTGSGANIGGLAGNNDSGGTIATSYSTGAVSGGSVVAGLAGNNGGTITHSYWDTQTSGQDTGIRGGINSGATGLSTFQMMEKQDNFSGFDFNTIWYLPDHFKGNTRPFLRIENTASIGNAHQLQMMDMDKSASYTLSQNIDMSELKQTPGMWGYEVGVRTRGFAPIGNNSSGDDTTRFTGTFDGLGHNVNGLFINRPITDYVGLFGYADASAAISNVGIAGGSITGQANVGALAGRNEGLLAYACTTGNVTGAVADIGGLVGTNAGTISQAYNAGVVTGSETSQNVGGLVGTNTGAIRYAYNTGAVTGNQVVGGLVGYNNGAGSTITDSYTTGAVTATNATDGIVGGLTGKNDGDIARTYSTGYVTGKGSNIGGMVGINDGTVNTSFWNMNTSGMGSGEGSSDGGCGSESTGTFDAVAWSTGIMMNFSVFNDKAWTFDSGNWSMYSYSYGQDISYPYLSWRFPIAPQIISGTAYDVVNNTTDWAGKTVHIVKGGADLGSTSVGHINSSGFYYFALDPVSVGTPDPFLLYISDDAVKGGSIYKNSFNNGMNKTDSGITPNRLYIADTGISNSILTTIKGSLSGIDPLYTESGSSITVADNICFETASGTTYTLDGNITTQGIDAHQTFGGSLANFGGDRTLISGGDITFNDAVNGGINTLTLLSGGAISQGSSGAITADKLSITSAGSADLSLASNFVNTLAANVSGSLFFKNNKSLEIGTVSSLNGISASGKVMIDASEMDTADITLSKPVTTTYAGDAQGTAIVLAAGGNFLNNT
ncbi:MAG TPA: GLUG motif-containing protein, partial [Smithellaceae bacterium]|nr:GLUG motif-containing protein [Smithellaceae bacterium]